MEYYLSTQSNQLLLHIKRWMNPERIMLSERRQIQKNKQTAKMIHVAYFHLYKNKENVNYSDRKQSSACLECGGAGEQEGRIINGYQETSGGARYICCLDYVDVSQVHISTFIKLYTLNICYLYKLYLKDIF